MGNGDKGSRPTGVGGKGTRRLPSDGVWSDARRGDRTWRECSGVRSSRFCHVEGAMGRTVGQLGRHPLWTRS